jgi:hypothetical protein
MNAGAHTDGGLNAVPLLNAVFCADCETISNSRHDACTVCGSRSLINLFRMLGGTVRSQKPQSAEDHAKTAKYNLELTVKVHEIPANEVNRVIESISRLAEVCGDLESLHINVESVFDTQAVAQSGLNLSNPPVANAITVPKASRATWASPAVLPHGTQELFTMTASEPSLFIEQLSGEGCPTKAPHDSNRSRGAFVFAPLLRIQGWRPNAKRSPDLPACRHACRKLGAGSVRIFRQ